MSRTPPVGNWPNTFLTEWLGRVVKLVLQNCSAQPQRIPRWESRCEPGSGSKIHEWTRSATFATSGRSSRSKLVDSFQWLAILVQADDRGRIVPPTFKLMLPDRCLNAAESDFMDGSCSLTRHGTCVLSEKRNGDLRARHICQARITSDRAIQNTAAGYDAIETGRLGRPKNYLPNTEKVGRRGPWSL